MFKIIDLSGRIYDAYGTFVDRDGDIQFIICKSDGSFDKTNFGSGYVRLYEGEVNK